MCVNALRTCITSRHHAAMKCIAGAGMIAMMTLFRLFQRLLPLLALLGVAALCALAASLLLGWTPGATGLPADIAAIQQPNNGN
jgi:hypothetical protein